MWKSAAKSERRQASAGGTLHPSHDVNASPGVDAFQWPPDPGADGREVLRVPDATRHIGESRMALVPDDPAADTGGVADPLPALRRTIQRREAAAASAHTNRVRATTSAARSSASPTWRRRHGLGVVFALTAAVAAIEADYILRTRGGVARDNAQPPAESAPAVPSAPDGSARRDGRAGLLAPPGGKLTVKSEPSAATVWIDGRAAGGMPLTLTNLPSGEHRVLVKRGSRSVEQTIRLDPANAASVIVPLRPASTSHSGWLAVTAPFEMDVLEAGVVVGTTRSPRIMLPIGSHRLRLRHALTGYDRWQDVQIDPGSVTRVEIALPQSTISLNALPWVEEAWIDGTSVGETPIGNLRLGLGVHEVVFRHPELGEKTVSVLVKAGVPARVSADMRK